MIPQTGVLHTLYMVYAFMLMLVGILIYAAMLIVALFAGIGGCIWVYRNMIKPFINKGKVEYIPASK